MRLLLGMLILLILPALAGAQVVPPEGPPPKKEAEGKKTEEGKAAEEETDGLDFLDEPIAEPIPYPEVLKEYRSRRKKVVTAEDHLELAKWCGDPDHDLSGEEIYHVLTALRLKPTHREALDALDKIEALEARDRSLTYARWTAANDRINIKSNLSRSYSRYWGRMVDALAKNFFQEFKYEGPPPPRGRVKVFRDRAEWRAYNRENREPTPDFALGVYIPGRHEMILAYDRHLEVDFMHILWHEATHLVTEVLRAPEARIPMWIQEGMAEYVGTSRYNEETGEMEWGQVNRLRVKELRESGMKLEPLEKLLQYMSYRDGFGSFQYAESWSFIHFLMHSKEESGDTPRYPYRQAYVKYFLRVVREGKKHDEAFKECFGAWKIEDLETGWKKHVEAMEFSPLHQALAKLDDAYYEEALEILGKETRSHPEDPMLRYWLGRVRFENQDYKEAVKEFQRVLVLEPAHHGAHAGIAEYYRVVAEGSDYKPREAVFHATAAALIGGTSEELHELAEIHYMNGNRKEALKYIDQAIAAEKRTEKLKIYEAHREEYAGD